MIHLSRCFQAPSLGVHFADYLLLHPTIRINLKIRGGGTYDDGLFGTMRPLERDRSFVLVQMEGRSNCRIAGKGHELEEGWLVAGRRNLGVNLRQEGGQRSLYVEWETEEWGEGPIGAGERMRLPARVFAELKERANQLGAGRMGVVEARLAAARIMEALREAAPPRALVAGELEHAVNPSLLALAHGLDRMYASMSGNPMVVDFQGILGWSRPRIHRTLSEFQKTYAFHGVGGWRELRRYWRMPLGVLLMSAPKATTEEVSSILGYSSPSAFCAAFAKSGLPSPGAIPEALARLR